MVILASALSGLSATGLFIAVGLCLLFVSAWITDRLTPGRLLEEISQKQNTSIACVTIGSWIGDACIIAAVIGGGSGTTPSEGLIAFTNVVMFNLALNSAVYGLLGMVVKALVFKAFDVVTPSVSFDKELSENNVAVGVMLGGLMLAVSLVIAAPLSS